MTNLIYLFVFLNSMVSFSQINVHSERLIKKENMGNVDRTLKTNGFYYSMRIRIESKNDTVKYVHPMILFESGKLLKFDYIGNSSMTLKRKGENQKCRLKPEQDFDRIIDFSKCYTEVVDERKIYSVYAINGNILKIQSLGNGYFKEKRGVILNDTTFVINQSIDYLTKEFENKKYLYQFKASNIPNPRRFKTTSTIQKYFFN